MVQYFSSIGTYTIRTADIGGRVMNMTGNLICGQVGGETARWVSERFPAVVKHKTTVSVNSMDTSVSKSEHTDGSISPATISNLSSGEFVGVLADDPENKMELKEFHVSIFKERRDDTKAELPVIREVTAAVVQECFVRVKGEIADLVESEMDRILEDPLLRGMVVRGS